MKFWLSFYTQFKLIKVYCRLSANRRPPIAVSVTPCCRSFSFHAAQHTMRSDTNIQSIHIYAKMKWEKAMGKRIVKKTESSTQRVLCEKQQTERWGRSGAGDEIMMVDRNAMMWRHFFGVCREQKRHNSMRPDFVNMRTGGRVDKIEISKKRLMRVTWKWDDQASWTLIICRVGISRSVWNYSQKGDAYRWYKFRSTSSEKYTLSRHEESQGTSGIGSCVRCQKYGSNNEKSSALLCFSGGGGRELFWVVRHQIDFSHQYACMHKSRMSRVSFSLYGTVKKREERAWDIRE